MIPQPFIHDLLCLVNIVEAINRHIPLKKSGANFVACCPFHSEKNPSFTVSQTKQFYHCFGCGAHGNAINFLIEYGGLSFVEAVHELADYVGIQVPVQKINTTLKPASSSGLSFSVSENKDSNAEIPSKDLIDALRAATQFYREQLKTSGKAITYLKKRGLSGKIAARFAIGYAPAGWQNLEAIFPDYKSEKRRKLLASAGLIIISDEGKQYDRFRDRIMFPILNQRGQIIGFGGRVLGQEEPKYLNSPETGVFEKGRELYNLFSARRAIRQANCAIVVEGYMDVIILSQHGIDYAVAALGTATTGFHIQKLLHLTDHIIFCFDGDKAGTKAAWRALENSLPLISDGKHLNFLFLPEGEDPDSYVRRYGKSSFEQKYQQAIPLTEFLFRELCSGINLRTNEGRAKLVSDAKPLLQQIKASALLIILLKRLVELSGISQSELEDLLQIKCTSIVRKVRRTPKKQPATPYYWLILIILYNPSYIIKLDKNLLVQYNENNMEAAALKTLVEFLDSHSHLIESKSAPSILAYLKDNPYRGFLESIEGEAMEWVNRIDLEAEFLGALEKLQQIQRKERMTQLHSKPLAKLTHEEKRELQRLSMLGNR